MEKENKNIKNLKPTKRANSRKFYRESKQFGQGA